MSKVGAPLDKGAQQWTVVPHFEASINLPVTALLLGAPARDNADVNGP